MDKKEKLITVFALLLLGVSYWFISPVFDENRRLLLGVFFLMWANNMVINL